MEVYKIYEKRIRLIVLVITITSTYDEANKIDRIPLENNLLIKIKKVTELSSVTFSKNIG